MNDQKRYEALMLWAAAMLGLAILPILVRSMS